MGPKCKGRENSKIDSRRKGKQTLEGKREESERRGMMALLPTNEPHVTSARAYAGTSHQQVPYQYLYQWHVPDQPGTATMNNERWH